jgi:sugar lactone lactonase YvrE
LDVGRATSVAITLLVVAACSSESKNDSTNPGAGGTVESGAGGSAVGGAGGEDAASGGTAGAAAGAGGAAGSAGSGGSGACAGKDCLGGNCANGKCEPVLLASDADDAKLKAPLGIAVDATHVYFTVNEYVAGKGLVMRASIAGGQLETLASGQDFPFHIALDSTHVYWTNKVDAGDAGVSGGVLRVLKSGGSPELIAGNEPGAAGVSVDATHVYWANHTATGAVKQRAKDGSDSVMVLASGQNKPYETWCDPGNSGNVYFTVQEDGRVRSVPKSGTAITNLSDAVPSVRPLALDGSSVFFGVFLTPGDVRTIPVDQGPNQISAGVTSGANFAAVVDLTVDASHVYFTTQRNTSASAPTYEGDVMRAPKAGGPVELVWRNQVGLPNPAGITHDSQAIYWTEYDAFAVYKLAK